MGRRDNESHGGQGRGGAALRRAGFQDAAGPSGEFEDCGGEKASKVGQGRSGHRHRLGFQASFGQQTPSLSDWSRLLFFAVVLFVFTFCVTLGKSGSQIRRAWS